MPSGKAQFTGHNYKVKEFSDKLRLELKAFYPGDDEPDEDFGDPADSFVNVLLMEARFGPSQVGYDSLYLKGGDLLAELTIVEKTLAACAKNLDSLSREIDIRLGTDVFPKVVAKDLRLLLERMGKARQSILAEGPQPIPAKTTRKALVEMAVRVLIALKQEGIAPSATAGEFGVSTAVSILKLIGDDVGLVREVTTWKRIVQDAKQQTGHLD